ncbi:hypothetical protein ACQP1W_02255 [Spirillospora sp. CA-255316]
MSHGAIDPAAIPDIQVDPGALEEYGEALKKNGNAVSLTVSDIERTWNRLGGVYDAPEQGRLLAAIKPIGPASVDFMNASVSAGQALIEFAHAARSSKQRLTNLKTMAQAFRAKIAGNDDWREDEDLAQENDLLVTSVGRELLLFKAAETECANRIASLVGGTRFSSPAPYTNLEGLKAPWGHATGQDKPWWGDVGDALGDTFKGLWSGFFQSTGLENADGELTGLTSLGAWWTNLRSSWVGKVQAIASLGPLYGPKGLGPQSVGENWGDIKNFVHGFVPWREWDERPGYVVTTGLLGLAGGAGLVKGVLKPGKGGHNADPRGGGAPPDPNVFDPSRMDPSGSGRGGPAPTTRQLLSQLEEAIEDAAQRNDLDDQFAQAERRVAELGAFPERSREPAMAGAGGASDRTINASHESPDGSPTEPGAADTAPRDPHGSEPPPALGGEQPPDKGSGNGSDKSDQEKPVDWTKVVLDRKGEHRPIPDGYHRDAKDPEYIIRDDKKNKPHRIEDLDLDGNTYRTDDHNYRLKSGRRFIDDPNSPTSKEIAYPASSTKATHPYMPTLLTEHDLNVYAAIRRDVHLQTLRHKEQVVKLMPKFGIKNIDDLNSPTSIRENLEPIQDLIRRSELPEPEKRERLDRLHELRTNADRWNRSRHVVKLMSEELGMRGGLDFVQHKLNAKIMTPIHSFTQKNDTLDIVGVHYENNRPVLDIVEAKGVGGSLQPRKVEDDRYAQQGSPEYDRFLLKIDKQLRQALEAPENRAVREQLRQELAAGRMDVRGYHVHVDADGSVKWEQFDLTRDGVLVKISKIIGLNM